VTVSSVTHTPPPLRFEKVVVDRLAYALPGERLTSAQIETHLEPVYQRLRLPSGRLELMTGIVERRLWPLETLPSQASSQAGQALFETPGFQAHDVDLLIHAAVCRDRLEPATAAYVHQTLGLPAHTQILDVSNACLGVLNAMLLAGGLIESGQIRHAVIVAGENGHPLLDATLKRLLLPDITRQSIKPYFANLTIGCGAVALSLRCADDAAKPLFRILGGVNETDSRHNHLCQGDQSASGGLEMQTDSEALLEAGLGVASRAWERFHALGSSFARIITHQVGRTHQRKLHQTLGIDPDLDFSTFPFLGNVGSVSCPISLALGEEQHPTASGERTALLGIGSGLSSLMLALEKIS